MSHRVNIIDVESVIDWLSLDNAELVSYLKLACPSVQLRQYHQVRDADRIANSDVDVVYVDTYTIPAARELVAELCHRPGRSVIVYGPGTLFEPAYFSIGDHVRVIRGADIRRVTEAVACQPSCSLPSCLGSDFSLLNIKSIRNYPLRSSKGCTNGCPFCVYSLDRRTYARSLVDIEREIDVAVSDYGAQALTIWDQCLNLNRPRLHEILHLLKTANLPWRSNGMTYQNVDKETIDALAESGCFLVSFGIESTSASVAAGKRPNVPQLQKIVNQLKTHDISVIGFFVVGLQGDSRERAANTMCHAEDLELDLNLFSSAIAYPGTALHAHVSSTGRFIADYKQLHLQNRDQLHFDTPYFPAGERRATLLETRRFDTKNAEAKRRLNVKLGCPYSSSIKENIEWNA